MFIKKFLNSPILIFLFYILITTIYFFPFIFKDIMIFGTDWLAGGHAKKYWMVEWIRNYLKIPLWDPSIRRGFKIRQKNNFLKKLIRDIERTGVLKFPVSISNSSDPYPDIEKKLKITRKSLEILKDIKDIRVSVLTKSPLVQRDIDILRGLKSTVSITITTYREELSKKLEPYAPSPKKRIEILPYFYDQGIPTSIRIDPLIPGVNTDKKDIEKLVKKISPYSKYIVLSTYKVKPDNFKRMIKSFPFLKKLPLKQKKLRGYRYLLDDIRFKLIEEVFHLIKNINPDIRVGTCREFNEAHFFKETTSCDPIFEI